MLASEQHDVQCGTCHVIKFAHFSPVLITVLNDTELVHLVFLCVACDIWCSDVGQGRYPIPRSTQTFMFNVVSNLRVH